MRITFISDTHTKHRFCESDLPGGDLLIHAGDFMNSGYSKREAIEFFDWFENISKYDSKVFIAGNHDRLMENEIGEMQGILSGYKTIDYLQDEQMTLDSDLSEDNVRIYGSPWQPEFYNWAFNLPRNGPELEWIWNKIPDNTDILITHGPAQGMLDTSGPPYNQPNLGCELLAKRINAIKPKIHVCGHIHGGYGYRFENDTHFINASILNERYEYVNKPITADWNKSTNEINFID